MLTNRWFLAISKSKRSSLTSGLVAVKFYSSAVDTVHFCRRQMAFNCVLLSDRRKESTTEEKHLIPVSSLAVTSEHSLASVRLLCGSNSSWKHSVCRRQNKRTFKLTNLNQSTHHFNPGNMARMKEEKLRTTHNNKRRKKRETRVKY